ncbi:uncharacterized protein LOC111695065 isoform X2 [Eurytemora carolleeae]|uniref:uncharacterized protein LOC111695065 isoform X2 n=1 Tax=Eurytemora carolleeae TaxID=1294199 RepID=UPI000C76A303|nr:uncharacterized protein LOC111695065 isoform X2 [Eurytemora carolleeae]|eukprot:XP_023319996.1 uncharacterized protein LOC111695065 isoform X2 [Eurytemora affinis]
MQKPSGKDPALYRKHRTGSVRFFYVVFNFHIRLYKGLVNTLIQLKAGIQEQIINHTFLLTYQYMISFMMPLEYMKDIMENFQAFCNQTSLHGWQYITQKPETDGFWSGFKHVFWSIIVCVAMGCAALFLYTNTIDFMNATVVTTVDTMTVPLSEVFFPSVLVCNINQVRKSFFSELGIYDNETFIRQVYYDFILGKANQSYEPENHQASARKRQVHEQIMKEYLAKHNETLDTKLSITWFTHQKCKDMHILSKWNGTKTYSFEIERDFGTDYGICCWYTPQLNFSHILEKTHESGHEEPDWGHWFMNVPKGAKTGKDNGYTMLFDIESFDYSYYDEGSEGLKLALVHHLDMPIMRQKGFHIAPGTENQIAVTPTLMLTSHEALNRFSAEQRDCYTEKEISLRFLPHDHGYRYEMSNCLFEAAFENILEKCKCAPGFHTIGGEAAMEEYDICMGANLTCMNDHLNRMGEFDHVEYQGKQVKCRSSCEDQVNSLFVTTSNYPNRKTLVYREEFCIVTLRLIDKCNSFKRKPLDRQYPTLCILLEDLRDLDICENNEWKTPKELNCTVHHCPLVEAVLNYARDNLVMFNIFIKDPYAKRFMKDEKITKTAYIANSGGLLGLCMGFSLVSAAEILYHCLFGLISPLCTRKKQDRLSSVRHESEDQNGRTYSRERIRRGPTYPEPSYYKHDLEKGIPRTETSMSHERGYNSCLLHNGSIHTDVGHNSSHNSSMPQGFQKPQFSGGRNGTWSGCPAHSCNSHPASRQEETLFDFSKERVI